MSFIMDLIVKEGVKYIPNLVQTLTEKLEDEEAILIVPSGDKVFIVIGKFCPRILEVTEDGKYVVSTATRVETEKYVIPDELDKLMSSMKKNG